MRSEDLYNAVTELPDDLVLEGEKPIRAAARRSRFRAVGAMAAAAAVLVAAGVFLLPKLTRERHPAATAESQTEPEQSQTVGTQPAETQPVETQAPFGTPEVSKYSLAAAAYPKMAPYPNEMDYMKGGDFDSDAYDTAWKSWRGSRMKLRPNEDYAKDMDAYLQKTIPALLGGAEGENRVVSPLNVYMALAMLAESTEGTSRQELLSLLNAPDVETLRARANALWRACYSDDGLQTCLLGASVWLRDDLDYRTELLDVLASDYYGSVYAGPMGAADYNTALRNWMNAQTGGLLADMIEGVEMTPQTVLALVTTVYLKAPWLDAFYQTEKRTFHSPEAEKEMTFLTEEGTASCWFGSDFTAAGKALSGGGDMFFLLPDEGVSPETLLKKSEVIRFLTDAAGRSRTENRSVRLMLSAPKFDVDSQIDLGRTLTDLGVKAVFDPELADFSPLTAASEDPIAVSQASHGARLMIDEQGVTAAAYTAIMVAGAAEPPEEQIELILDRPFLFVVTNADGLPLFVGIVNEP